MSRTVVAEVHGTKSYAGVYYGYTLYGLDNGEHEVVLRTRTYDGIRVADKWDSEPISIIGGTKETAIEKSREHVIALIKSLTIGSAPVCPPLA